MEIRSLMSTSARFCIIAAMMFTHLAGANDTAKVGDIGTQGDKANVGDRIGKPSLEGKELNAAIRGAIFSNRKQLLEFLGDPKSRSAICTPNLNDSYELFQVSVREELDVLWDLDIYASKYSLNKKEHQTVKTCSAQMEKYLDNFKLWQTLTRRASPSPMTAPTNSKGPG